MDHLPKIHVTSTGKKYFNVNDRRIYIASGVTRKQILSIYKALQKPKNNTNKTRNSAHAVVNINNGPTHRSKRQRRYVKFTSTIDPLLRSTATSGSVTHPKDSGDKDLLNKLLNEVSGKLMLINEHRTIKNKD